MGEKETSVTAAIIVAKSLEFNNVRELMEETFSQLVEDKSAYISQGKRKIGRNKYTSLRKTYDLLSSQLYHSHSYNQSYLIDAAYTGKS